MQMLKSKTVWGGIIAGAGKILATVGPLATAGILGPKVQGVTMGVGMILAAVGVRSAISVNGQGK